jgi:hypothetical protein
MEYRIKDYTIKGQRILLPRQTSIEDLRLIFNETQKKLICSTATKDNVTLVQGEGGTLVEVPTSVCSLNSTDLLTIKCDYGDNLEEVKEAIGNTCGGGGGSQTLEEFFGVKPIDGYEFMTPEEICAELEEIMTSMDLDLTPEKAKEITQQTLNN